jgi:hypothetical protein
VSRCNIVGATPFGREPMKELAQRARTGIRLCFYCAHAQDWHEPAPATTGTSNFTKYFEAKAILRFANG